MDEIVYLSLGEGHHVAEVRFALSSALHFWRPDAPWRVVLYTDQPRRFDDVEPVEVRVVPASQVEAWVGPHGYVFLGKIRVLEDALGRAGRAVLVDGDTYFRKDPAVLLAAVRPGRGVLHEREGLPHPPEVAGIRAALRHGPLHDADGAPWPLHERTILWNTGVVGLSEADRALCGEVAHLTTALLDAGFADHSRIAEMLAFSVVLEQRVRIGEADATVVHYWRDEIRRPFHARLADEPDRSDAAQIRRRLWPHRPRPTLRRRLKHAVKRRLARVGVDFNRR